MSEPVTVTIDAGICGFRTVVRAATEDGQMVTFDIDTPCENIRSLAAKITEVDSYEEIGAGFDGQILSCARETLKGCCSGCVVPNGIFKAMQVAGSIALPADVSLKMVP